MIEYLRDAMVFAARCVSENIEMSGSEPVDIHIEPGRHETVFQFIFRVAQEQEAFDFAEALTRERFRVSRDLRPGRVVLRVPVGNLLFTTAEFEDASKEYLAASGWDAADQLGWQVVSVDGIEISREEAQSD